MAIYVIQFCKKEEGGRGSKVLHQCNVDAKNELDPRIEATRNQYRALIPLHGIGCYTLQVYDTRPLGECYCELWRVITKSDFEYSDVEEKWNNILRKRLILEEEITPHETKKCHILIHDKNTISSFCRNVLVGKKTYMIYLALRKKDLPKEYKQLSNGLETCQRVLFTYRDPEQVVSIIKNYERVIPYLTNTKGELIPEQFYTYFSVYISLSCRKFDKEMRIKMANEITIAHMSGVYKNMGGIFKSIIQSPLGSEGNVFSIDYDNEETESKTDLSKGGCDLIRHLYNLMIVPRANEEMTPCKLGNYMLVIITKNGAHVHLPKNLFAYYIPSIKFETKKGHMSVTLGQYINKMLKPKFDIDSMRSDMFSPMPGTKRAGMCIDIYDLTKFG